MARVIQSKNPIDLQPSRAVGFGFPLDGDAVFIPTFTTREQTKANMINYLLTNKGERVFRPDFGADLRALLFENIIDAEIEDLNSDGSPEILIYTISAGSGSYGNVIGYSVNNGKSVSQIYFPEITENKEASSGYMGHDEFAIIETSLARRFPVYKDGDTNNNPTGGTRQIEYKLKDGEASRLFVINKISDY